jgi:hypothetical protein
MGFCVILENESGEPIKQIEDPVNMLHQLLPSEDASYQYLRFIDWYGDTLFNRLQMQPFLAEWHRLTESAQTMDEKALLARINDLALQCSREPHLYLRFCGD